MHRMMLEMHQHSESSFVTLTYNDGHKPLDGSLVPKDLQDWLKRIRKDVEPLPLRFFAVGEYGEVSRRPHYHVALFGYPNCLRGQTETRRLRCCTWCDRLSDTWNKGGILSGQLTEQSAQYIVGYVVKKMTRVDDPRLEGLHPEFARMSLRPGIGAYFAKNIAASMQKFNLDYSEADAPSALRHGKRILPLGRYIKGKVREELFGSTETPPKAQAAHTVKMLELFEEAKKNQTTPKEILQSEGLNGALRLNFQDKLKKRNKL